MINNETHYYTVIILWQDKKITTSIYTSRRKMKKDLDKLFTKYIGYIILQNKTEIISDFDKRRLTNEI